MIPIKSASDIAVMRESGGILAEILRTLCREIRPGRTTAHYDRHPYEACVCHGL